MFLVDLFEGPGTSIAPWISMFVPTLVLIITLSIIFKIKKDKAKTTSYIFSILMTSNLWCVSTITLAMILIYNFNITNIVTELLIRLFLVCNDQFIIFINMYVISIIHKDSTGKEKNTFNKTFRNHIIMAVIICTIQMCLPVNLENAYFNGIGSTYSSVFFLLDATFWLYLLIRYHRRITMDKVFQSILLVVLGTMAVITSAVIKSSHLVTIIQFIIIYILYLKTENPDIKYINELNKSKNETEKALSAKNDFLDSMTEELSEPLNDIIEKANEMYSYRDQVNSEVQDDLDFILPTSKNLYEIVGNIIDINKIENNEIKIYEAPYNPINAIKDVIESEKMRVNNPNIEIKYEADNDIPETLTGDETHVKQIVHNLVSNALKYTEKGTVEIIVTAEQTSYDTYTLKIKVADTGIGIKNETLINLFTNFSKTTEQKNSNVAGTGLGLSITKKLIDLLNGNITVESIYGSGSTFTVTIPQKI